MVVEVVVEVEVVEDVVLGMVEFDVAFVGVLLVDDKLDDVTTVALLINTSTDVMG